MEDNSQQYPDPAKFEDPLENYEPKTYNDSLEQALAEESVEAIQSTPYVSVSPDTPIRVALDKLADLHVACLLIEQDHKLLGIFSDRDVLDKVALEYEEVKDRPVREVMTENPVVVHGGDSSATTLTVMAVAGYRHVPVLDDNDHIVGIVSPQRVTRFLQRHMTKG